MKDLQFPTWETVKAECDVLDQMASQTVLKACDIGDMLRQIRATMLPEEFETQCVMDLSKSYKWACQMMLLSFRREGVLKALSDGEANDSIRGAYGAVKSLPQSDAEKAERKTWPKKKAGRPKGSKEKTVTRDSKAVTSDQKQPVEAKEVKKKAYSWRAVAVEEGVISSAGSGGSRDKFVKDLREICDDEDIFTAEREEDFRDMCSKVLAVRSPEIAKKEAIKAKDELSKTAQQKLDTAIKKHIAVIQADAAVKIAAEVERRIAERQKEFDRREQVLLAQQKTADAMVEKYRKLMARKINGFDAKTAFKTLKQVAHPDRWEGNQKLAQNAMHVIKELESIFS